MNEQKAKCEATEKRESERRQVEEKKHNEEIQFLKRTNQQLKVKGPRSRLLRKGLDLQSVSHWLLHLFLQFLK